MASFNKVILMGNLTRDPEVRYTSGGTAVTDLRLAVNRTYRSASGEDKEETVFVSCDVWGRQAETSGEYLSKGSQVLVEGRLKLDEWEKDGQKFSRLGVTAERVQFLGSPRRSSAPGDAPPDAGSGPRPPSGGRGQDFSGEEEDDIPF